jgi:predicted Zn-dependent protease
MSNVKKTRKGVVVRLEPEEAALVRALMEQLVTLLGDVPGEGGELASVGIAENAVKPDDPVLARLFPDAYREDGEAAGEFRRYTEMGLRDGKREAARTVLTALKDAGGDILLDQERAQIWLRALNDVRLALGTRLDISEEWYEEAEQLDPRDPRTPMFAAYDWLTMLQEGLVRALW